MLSFQSQTERALCYPHGWIFLNRAAACFCRHNEYQTSLHTITSCLQSVSHYAISIWSCQIVQWMRGGLKVYDVARKWPEMSSVCVALVLWKRISSRILYLPHKIFFLTLCVLFCFINSSQKWNIQLGLMLVSDKQVCRCGSSNEKWIIFFWILLFC